jgi:hypothetical protein
MVLYVETTPSNDQELHAVRSDGSGNETIGDTASYTQVYTFTWAP